MNKQQLIAAFADKFAGAIGIVYASPGRINLIGELYDIFTSRAVEAFEAKYGHKPVIIPVVIGDGSRKI